MRRSRSVSPCEPSSTRPAATAASVSVAVSPPKTSAASVRLRPTFAPTTGAPPSPSGRTTVPPPNGRVMTSGIRELVRTPATATGGGASRG